MGRTACLNCECGNGVCRRVQMGQAHILPIYPLLPRGAYAIPPLPVDLDVLLGPIAPPPPPEANGSGTTPVFKTTVTAPYPERNQDWLWLALGAVAIVAVSRR